MVNIYNHTVTILPWGSYCSESDSHNDMDLWDITVEERMQSNY